jgi:hypothetical protein
MPRIEVDPGRLSAAGGAQEAAAGALVQAAQALQSAAETAAGAAGEGGASGALSDWGHGWFTSLQVLAGTVEAAAGNVSAAGDAYLGTDAGAMPGKPS